MAHEFDYAELYPCDMCGELYPTEEMIELENGMLVCENCAGKMQEQ